MIQRTIHTASLLIVSLLLVLTAGKSVAVPVQYQQADVQYVSEQVSFTAEVLRSVETFEMLSSVHHLPTIIDVAETTETESEDDDEYHAHSRTVIAFQGCLRGSSLARATLTDCPHSFSIPLYILHHSWKHFVSPVLA